MTQKSFFRQPAKLRAIEAARALAAIAVVLMHAANLMRVEHFSGHIGLGGLFDFGYVGVDFFFVLSGFIITFVHFHDIGHPGRIPYYLWRRFSRIYPIYWSILLLSIFVLAVGRLAIGKPIALDFGPEDIAGTIFLLISQSGTIEPKFLGVAWSLQFEVLFYIAFCVLLVNARLGFLFFSAWGLIIISGIVGLVNFKLPFGLGSAHCLQFLSGVAVGALARRYTLRAQRAWLIPVFLIFVAAVIFEVYGPLARHSAEGRVALGLASAAVLVLLVALENTNSIETPKWLVSMGSVSYSIYLGHILFINLTYSILLKLGIYHALPEAVVLGLAITVALTATMLIGKHVELPLVKALKDRN
jgi:peptidoglycan/LPS O-acetylase OafA/YrhL